MSGRFRLPKDGAFVKRLSPVFVLVLLVVLCTLGIAPAALAAQSSLGPLAQQAYLKASTIGERDLFGNSVAVSGDTVVVGGHYKNAAHVFVRDGATWSLQAELTGDGYFGRSVAISGDTLVVGAPYRNNQSGGAYVFVRSGATWSQQAYLEASDPAALDWFGTSVAISGDTVVVGADGKGLGGAYVFVRDGVAWSQQTCLTGSSDYFGQSVAISGNTIVVGSCSTEGTYGAAYVFVRDGATWSPQATLTRPYTSGEYSWFGSSVAISGDTVAVGAHGEDSVAYNSGAAFIFERDGTTWSQQAYLKAPTVKPYDAFGYALAVSGDTLVVGAAYESSSATGVNGDQTDHSAPNAGAAYVFVRDGTTWVQKAYLKASNTEADDNFGYSVAVSGGTVVAGAYLEDGNATGVNGDDSNNDVDNAGAAYVFAPLPTIAVTAGPGGSITPPTGAVSWGADATYTITPAARHLIASILVDDVALTGFDSTGDTYTFTAVTANHAISATFTRIRHTLSYTCTSGGSLRGETLQSVPDGADGTPVLAVPDVGFLFAGWSDWVRHNPRTDTRVTSDLAVVARFVPIPEPPLPEVHSVSAAITQGKGSVSPAAQWVRAGESAAIDIVCAPGYHLSWITLDGRPMPLSDPFVIAEVNACHRVQVGLVPDELPPAFAFPDVPEGHTFHPAVTHLAERGILAGYANGAFGLDDPILRAQVAKMLVLALAGDWGYPYGSIPEFIDVPDDGSPYPHRFVMAAARAGVVVGYTDGRFRPYAPITRMQLVRMVVRASSELLEEPPAGYDPGFTDVTGAADRALLALATYNQLIGGAASGTFSPATLATRGEAAYALYRVLLLKQQGLE